MSPIPKFRRYLQYFLFLMPLLLGCKVEAADLLSIPKLSDVAFSSRWFYPSPISDHESTYDALEGFFTTRVLWVYLDPQKPQDHDFVRTLNERKIPVQAAVNPAFPIYSKEMVGDFNLLGVKIDVKQQPIAISKNMYFGCPSSPVLKNKLYSRIADAVSFPVDSVQFDDWTFHNIVFRAPKSYIEKCYCTFCVTNFQKWLEKKSAAELAQAGVSDPATFDYRQFILENGIDPNNTVPAHPLETWYNDSMISTLDQFWKTTYRDIQAMAGRTLSVSANAFFFVPVKGPFDYAVSELQFPYNNPQGIFDRVQYNLSNFKRRTVFTSGGDPSLTRKMIAWTTASGGVHLVPWDVYMVDAPRYFGKAQDYADLYGFIRANEQYLEGYTSFAVAGANLKSSANAGAIEVLNSKTVLAYLRLKNGLSSRVVVHVVDSSDQPSGCTLKIMQLPGVNPTQFNYTLTTPKDYDKDLYEAVKISEDFTRLVKYQKLNPRIQNGYIYLDLPPVKPWGMLIIH